MQSEPGKSLERTQDDTAGDTILHQQYILLLLLVLDAGRNAAVVPVEPPRELQNPTNSKFTPSQFAVPFDWLSSALMVTLVHVVVDGGCEKQKPPNSRWLEVRNYKLE